MTMPPTPQPEFVDNRDGNTLGRPRARSGGWPRTSCSPPTWQLPRVLQPEGFGRVADALEKVGRVSAAWCGARPPPARPEWHLGDPRGALRRLLRDALDLTEAGLLRDRDALASHRPPTGPFSAC